MTRLTALAASVWLITAHALGGDWITEPSYYTHDATTGERVQQYTPIGPFYTYPRGDFTRSGFRHTRSSIQVGGSADHYHLTEQWGKPIQPYGEWRHPYRPYSVPYDAWAPPFGGGFRRGYPYGGIRGGFGFPPGGGINPPVNNPNLRPAPSHGTIEHHGYSGQQQLLDGRYPPFEDLDPFERKQLFDNLYPLRPLRDFEKRAPVP